MYRIAFWSDIDAQEFLTLLWGGDFARGQRTFNPAFAVGTFGWVDMKFGVS